MFIKRPAGERGGGDHGWLDTRHTFSFADYHDPRHMGFRALRVLNEDRVAPGGGFGRHPHRDMEIVTVVLSGALEHQDSMGHREVLRPGEVQAMTAGTGILHSEVNPSATEPVHLVQIWLKPDRPGHTPGYGQKAFDTSERQGRWQTVVTPDGADGTLPIHQDARLLLADVPAGGELPLPVAPGRHVWLQVLVGAGSVDGQAVAAGDGLHGPSGVATFAAAEPSTLLLFDLG